MGRKLLRDEVPVLPCKVRALYSWSGEGPQDLGFVEGDVIEVFNNGDGDWWTGKLKRTKQVGNFPRNFAEYVDANQETISAAKTTAMPTVDSNMIPIDFSTVSLSDLAISDPQAGEPPSLVSNKVSRLDPGTPELSSSLFGSKRSNKSAQEIIDEISSEMNQKFLDDINLDMHPEDLLGSTSSAPKDTVGSPVPPPHRSLRSSTNSRHSTTSARHSRSQSLVPEEAVSADQQPKKAPIVDRPTLGVGNGIYDAAEATNNELKTPVVMSSDATVESKPQDEPKSSALTGPVLRKAKLTPKLSPELSPDLSPQLSNLSFQPASPMLDQEIPFDPREFKPERPIGAHIGSHFENEYNPSAPASVHARDSDAGASHALVSKPANPAPVVAKTLSKAYSTRKDPPPPVSQPGPQKLNFFQRLLPMNSATLKRRSSRSSIKSSKSSKSTKFGGALRTVKSKFAFLRDHSDDDDLYPTNMPVISQPAAPQVKRTLTARDVMSKSVNRGSVASAAAPVPALSGSTTTQFGGLSSTGFTGTSGAHGAGSIGGSSGPASSGPASNWIESRRDLYRAQTLGPRDVAKRRQELELQGVNCADLVEGLDEPEFHDYRLEDFMAVDDAVLHMSTWPQLMTPSVFASSRIGRHFKDPIERVRAVFLLCSTRIEHVDQSAPHNSVMQTRRATPQELATTVQQMCQGVGVECQVVEGHLRKVDRQADRQGSRTADHQHLVSVPHFWNAVKVNDEWRLLDARSAALCGDEDVVNLFYFLTPPAQLLFSHVPVESRQQFLTQSLQTNMAALLPLASPAAFAHNVVFDSYWLGATRLTDLEVGELQLRVPNTSDDLIATVDGHAALAQAFYKDGNRLFRVKAFVPARQKQALLQIFAVDKRSNHKDSQELLWSVELRHVSGLEHNSPFEFVERHSAPMLAANDFYICEPQCRALSGGDVYNFRIENFSKLDRAAPQLKGMKQPQLAVQSPSGRLTRMVPKGTDVCDEFRASVKTMEVGAWRAVGRDREGEWVPFAEWFCS